MVYIEKSLSSKAISLLDSARAKYGTYKELKSLEKREIVAHLLAEQSGLCCYCQQVVPEARATIEHLVPQSEDPNASLQYANLYVSCENNSHCNLYRQNKRIEKYIQLRDCERYFSYERDGTILENGNSDTDTLRNLNLNHTFLKANREIFRKRYLRLKSKGSQPSPNMAFPGLARQLDQLTTRK